MRFCGWACGSWGLCCRCGATGSLGAYACVAVRAWAWHAWHCGAWVVLWCMSMAGRRCLALVRSQSEWARCCGDDAAGWRCCHQLSDGPLASYCSLQLLSCPKHHTEMVGRYVLLKLFACCTGPRLDTPRHRLQSRQAGGRSGSHQARGWGQLVAGSCSLVRASASCWFWWRLFLAAA